MAIDVVRAWKDPEYRKTLTSEELASLPANPAGASEVSDEELGEVAGCGWPRSQGCAFFNTRLTVQRIPVGALFSLIRPE
jgi:mersacidin/lichenicidin family type 2 lantibiotic